MAHKVRPRLLYPGVYRQSDKHQGIGLAGFVVWTYLMAHADDDGIAPLLPATIASEAFLLFEGKARTLGEIEKIIKKLVDVGLVHDYTMNGRRYYAMHDFLDFQWVRPRDYQATTYPKPEGWRPGTQVRKTERPPAGSPEDAERRRRRREYAQAMDREREQESRVAAAAVRTGGMPEHVRGAVDRILNRSKPQEGDSE